jgi:hypothetical protein
MKGSSSLWREFSELQRMNAVFPDVASIKPGDRWQDDIDGALRKHLFCLLLVLRFLAAWPCWCSTRLDWKHRNTFRNESAAGPLLHMAGRDCS